MNQIEQLMAAKSGSSQADELELLTALVKPRRSSPGLKACRLTDKLSKSHKAVGYGTQLLPKED
jgi:hypothetical protein